MKKNISVIGMHCKACEKMVADELKEIKGLKNVRVSSRDGVVHFVADEGVSDYEIERAIERAGYKVGREDKPVFSHNPKDYKVFFLSVMLVAAVFLIFSKFGLSPLGLAADNSNDGLLALIMGLTAGFSTCAALVGGLVIGLAARHELRHPNATKMQNFRPHIFFNVGRVGGFVIFGVLMGLVGSAFTFSPLALGILTLLAGVLMLVIGLQLTGIFPRLTSFSLPQKLAEKLGIDRRKKKEYSHFGAVVLGVLTFFLPCGFTQSMQLLAVSTGSPAAGALIMGLFAVGTTPGLLAIGGIASIITGKKAKTIFKVVGVFVAAMALSSIITGVQLAGFRVPEFNLGSSKAEDILEENVPKLVFNGSRDQFDKDEVKVQKGQKYRLEITVNKSGSGCMSAVMLPELSNAKPQLLKAGKVVNIEFKAKSAGVYELMCAMGIPFNTRIIVEE
ncbi:MAG: sulfite exporter TauE/SafE family protein [Candidatus Nomurabacteria bacterium]|jgi:sulfite exporter TauE/SafE/copper chaperone CopZ|nr:sulfite exporter TauE/SafE family protein [Candidatus Nomurabacteria bacterium]